MTRIAVAILALLAGLLTVPLVAQPAVAEANGGIRIAQEASAGTTIANELMLLADAIKDGKQTPESASAKALALIEEGTSRKGG